MQESSAYKMQTSIAMHLSLIDFTQLHNKDNWENCSKCKTLDINHIVGLAIPYYCIFIDDVALVELTGTVNFYAQTQTSNQGKLWLYVYIAPV